MSQDQKICKATVVAPKLYDLDGLPWKWVALQDLTEAFGVPVPEIWEQYCQNARTAVLAKDWNGSPWKFCYPVADRSYSAKDVWDMKTGARSQVPENDLPNVLVPAGWSKAKNAAAHRLETVLRETFEKAHLQSTIARVEDAVANAAISACREQITEAVEGIGTYADLRPTLYQLESAPKGNLMIRVIEHEPLSSVKLHIWDPKPHRDAMMRINIEIRYVLGALKVIKIDAKGDGQYHCE